MTCRSTSVEDGHTRTQGILAAGRYPLHDPPRIAGPPLHAYGALRGDGGWTLLCFSSWRGPPDTLRGRWWHGQRYLQRRVIALCHGELPRSLSPLRVTRSTCPAPSTTACPSTRRLRSRRIRAALQPCSTREFRVGRIYFRRQRQLRWHHVGERQLPRRWRDARKRRLSGPREFVHLEQHFVRFRGWWSRWGNLQQRSERDHHRLHPCGERDVRRGWSARSGWGDLQQRRNAEHRGLNGCGQHHGELQWSRWRNGRRHLQQRRNPEHRRFDSRGELGELYGDRKPVLLQRRHEHPCR